MNYMSRTHRLRSASSPHFQGRITMKLKTALLMLAFAFVVSPLLAQQATLNRNSILRSDSSNTSTALEHLKKGASVTLLSNPSQGGYYHVTAGDGQPGWVWGRN